MNDPRSGAEIAAALRTLHQESVAYWSSFDTSAFLAPIGEAWSPADNVRHLTKSIRAVTTGLKLPPIVVRLLYGGATAPSRDYASMRDTYRARLAKGADAGKFAPGPRRPDRGLAAPATGGESYRRTLSPPADGSPA